MHELCSEKSWIHNEEIDFFALIENDSHFGVCFSTFQFFMTRQIL